MFLPFGQPVCFFVNYQHATVVLYNDLQFIPSRTVLKNGYFSSRKVLLHKLIFLNSQVGQNNEN